MIDFLPEKRKTYVHSYVLKARLRCEVTEEVPVPGSRVGLKKNYCSTAGSQYKTAQKQQRGSEAGLHLKEDAHSPILISFKEPTVWLCFSFFF